VSNFNNPIVSEYMHVLEARDDWSLLVVSSTFLLRNEWWISWHTGLPTVCKVCLLSIIANCKLLSSLRCKSPGLHAQYNSHYNYNFALLEPLWGAGCSSSHDCMMSLVSSIAANLYYYYYYYYYYYWRNLVWKKWN
jgi:hypothetical protein